MKKTAAGLMMLFLSLPLLSTVLADEQEDLRKECREVGKQHGIEDARMEDWVGRCVENIRELQKRRQQQQEQQRDGTGGMERGDERER